MSLAKSAERSSGSRPKHDFCNLQTVVIQPLPTRLVYRFLAVFKIRCFLCFSKHGCHVLLLSPDELSLRYPWMNTDGVALASLGKKFSCEIHSNFVPLDVCGIMMWAGNRFFWQIYTKENFVTDPFRKVYRPHIFSRESCFFEEGTVPCFFCLFFFPGGGWALGRRQRQRKPHLQISIWEMVTILWLLFLPLILY